MFTKITKFCIVAFATLAVVSCAKQVPSSDEMNGRMNQNLSESIAQQEFAQVLSQAINDNADLRAFLKKEALNQFDNDYDVFYPYVKDKVITSGETFKDILLMYCSKEKLAEIEVSLPKLTILVPDWKWCDGFSVNDWNTSENRIAVGFDKEEGAHTLYCNGEIIGQIGINQIPAFPVIIIKSNERMKVVSPATKGSEAMYDFVDDAFDGSKRHQDAMTKGVVHQYYDRLLPTEIADNFVPSSELDSRVIGAYNEFNGIDTVAHRDYIYYGMTRNNTVGSQNYHIREVFYKYRMRTFNSSYLQENGDLSVSDTTKEIKGRDFTNDELTRYFYGNGNLDLVFSCIVKNSNGSFANSTICQSVSFNNLFALDKTHVDFRHKTWFCRDWYVYTIDDDCFTPKWVVANVNLPRWNIYDESCIMTFQVEEHDSGATTTIEHDVTSAFTKNFSLKPEVSDTVQSVVVKTTGGLSIESKKETTDKYSIVTTNTSDDLGSTLLYYTDPIILSQVTKNGVQGYEIMTLSTGLVDFMIIPRYY